MDSMRAIAALLILVFHLALALSVPAWSSDIFNAATVGVPVFFVISGFLLYRPFAVSHLRGAPGSRTAAFAWRRFLRIAPVYWATLTVVLLFGTEHTEGVNPLTLYGFAQVYDPTMLGAGLSQAWSLDNEVVFYVMLPLLALGVRSAAAGLDQAGRRRVEIAGLIALLVISEAYKGWFATFGQLANGREQIFMFQPAWNLDLFVLGMAVALWSAHREVAGGADRLSSAVHRHAGLFWLAALAMYGANVALAGVYYDTAGNFALHAARAAFAVLLILPVIFGRPGEGLVRRFLGQRWLLAIGVMSYAVYLFHSTVIVQLTRIDRGGLPEGIYDAALIVGTLVVTLGLSAASWVLFERPILSLKRVVPDRRGAESAREAASVEHAVPARANP
jgi:peptidoglycan/LPS O-acetylase OafA/YrhL